ncbi:hypothetical protein C1645_770146 [Glomus cerebriforme]|uniref:Uncharacterized protein n=1 Tax=Glomus cerebriforme TaxID=658196 RepID=A0A397T292_9GLOM|nr:hypothetical protein C1645_770146 [Glomus cerebriforme]
MYQLRFLFFLCVIFILSQNVFAAFTCKTDADCVGIGGMGGMGGRVCAMPPPNEGFCVRVRTCIRPDGSTTTCGSPLSR